MSISNTTSTKSKIQHIKKEKVQKPEPEYCGVCMENYTSIIRKKCVCKYCKADSCSKCIERYLLDRHEDAHCLHCRVNYNDIVLNEICTKTYLRNTYFKHRQEVLINRERSNLPGLQDIAIDKRRKRNNYNKIMEIKRDIFAITSERTIVLYDYNLLYIEYYNKKTESPKESKIIRTQLDEILLKSEALKIQINNKKLDIHDIKYPPTYDLSENVTKKLEEEKKKFIRRCTVNNCQGFLSTAWKCGICEYYSCSKCFLPKTKKHDDLHECKKEDVETAEMIKKDSKPCPNCGEFIMKASGCFAKDTPILMWDTGVKMSQNICIGDELVGDDGLKRTVFDTTNGTDMMYEVKQNSGISYVVNSKHTLVLKYLGENTLIEIIVEKYILLDNDIKSKLYGVKFINNTFVETIIEVLEVGIGEYFGWSVDNNKRFLLNDTTVLRNCDQMFCISCQTPWSWNTGKVVTSGPIHNPHYYEWMKRNGTDTPRNPADIPCGGYPNAWELRRMPKGLPHNYANIFFEFHRICQELQDISTRNYRSHIDNTTNDTNVNFLLGDFDEKHWGQLLAKNERMRKRDNEVQEIFAAFRMVAVELINRVQQYNSEDGTILLFTNLPLKEAKQFLNDLNIEINALIKMINDALRNASISYRYSVPYIHYDNPYYSIKTQNFSYMIDNTKDKKEVDNNTNISQTEDEIITTNNPIIIPSNGFAYTDIDTYTDNDKDIDTIIDEDKIFKYR